MAFRDDELASTSALARRLEDAVQAPIDVARLSRVRSEAPLLLLQAIDDGRVLVDRDDCWTDLGGSRETIARAARRRLRRACGEAAESIAHLMEL